MYLEGEFLQDREDSPLHLEAAVTNTNRRYKINRKEEPDLISYLSRVNTVIFSPESLGVVKGGPALRRAFIDLKSKNRSQAFTLPRQIAMYLSRELTTASTTEVGRRFGGKDHSTVIHSTNKIQGIINKDSAFSTTIQRLRETVESL